MRLIVTVPPCGQASTVLPEIAAARLNPPPAAAMRADGAAGTRAASARANDPGGWPALPAVGT